MSTPVDYDDLWPGRLVMWVHVPRGGWGYVVPVRATVVRVTRSRVTIDAQLARGGTKRITVTPESLRDTPETEHATRAARGGAPTDKENER